MFGLGTFEIALILLAVLLIYGPEQIPSIAKKIGQYVKYARAISDEVSKTVRREIHEMEKIEELKELKKQGIDFKQEMESIAQKSNEIVESIEEKTKVEDDE